MTLSLLMVVSVTNTSVLAYNQLSEADAVKSAAEEYLRTQMNRVYQWDTANNMEPKPFSLRNRLMQTLDLLLNRPCILATVKKALLKTKA